MVDVNRYPPHDDNPSGLRQRVQGMQGIPDQIPKGGSAAASRTKVHEHGALQATASLFHEFTAQFLGGPRQPRQDFAGLIHVPKLTPRALAKLQSQPPWNESGGPLPVILDLVAALHAARGGAAVSDAAAVFQRTMEAAADEAAAALGKAVHGRLRQGSADSHAVEAIRDELSAVDLAPPDLTSLDRLIAQAQRVNEFRNWRGRLPPPTFERASENLLSQLKNTFNAAQTALAGHHIAQRLNRHRGQLLAKLDGFRRRRFLLEEHLAAARREFEQQQQALADEQQRSSSSTVVHIAGPTEAEVYSELSATLDAREPAEIAAKLGEQYLRHLKEYARRHAPHLQTDKTHALLLAFEAALLAALFAEVVAAARGHARSLYPLIEARGLRETARELFDRAEVMAGVGPRAQSRFGHAVASITIVRLPPPIGPRDPEIKDRLAQDFRALAKRVVVNEGTEEQRDVTVVRMEAGYPIGLMNDTCALLERYARAADHGHPLHLVGFLPDSDSGSASKSHLELWKRLKEQPHDDPRPGLAP